MDRVVFENRQIPLHYQIADYLRMMLERGTFNADDRLPPEEELKEIFGVSRMTVRHALDHLIQKDLLVRRQGKGTFWTSKASERRKSKPSGINREIFKISEKTSVTVLSKRKEKAPPAVAEFLGIPPGETVMVFERTRKVHDEPMSYTINYLPLRLGAGIGKKHLEVMTMLETLERILRINLGVIEHVVEVTRAGAEIAKHLGIAALDPVLTVRTSVFDEGNKPLEIVWTHFVENKYKFRVVLDK